MEKGEKLEVTICDLKKEFDGANCNIKNHFVDINKMIKQTKMRYLLNHFAGVEKMI